MATLSNDQLQKLYQLLVKYHTVAAIPASELRAIGVAPSEAMVIVSSLPTPKYEPDSVTQGLSLTKNSVFNPGIGGSRGIGDNVGNFLGGLGDAIAGAYNIANTPFTTPDITPKTTGGFSGGGEFGGAGGSFGVPASVPKAVTQGINPTPYHDSWDQRPTPSVPTPVTAGSNPTQYHDSWDQRPQIPDFSKSVEYNPPREPVTQGSNPTQYHDSWDQRPQNPPDTSNPNGLPDPSMGLADIIAAAQQQQTYSPPPQLPMPQMVSLPSVPEPPKFKLNDFTDQANAQAAKAYSPEFAALDAARQQINQNYTGAKQVIGGLYDQANQAISQNTQDLAAANAAAQQAAQDRAAQAQTNIGDMYASSQGQMADLLAKLGAGTKAGADILPRGAEQQAWAKAMAQQASQNNLASLQRKGAADAAYEKGIGQAIAQEGRVQQQNLIGQKSNYLAQNQQNVLNAKAQQAQQALALANALQQSDFGLQQANYGAAQDAYNNMIGQAQFAQGQLNNQYDAQLQQAQANQQYAASVAQQQQAQQQAVTDAINSYYDRLMKQAQLNHTYNQDDIANAQAAAKLELQRQQQQNSYNLGQQNAGIAQQNADTAAISAAAKIAQAKQAAGQAPDKSPDTLTGKIAASLANDMGVDINNPNVDSAQNFVIQALADNPGDIPGAMKQAESMAKANFRDPRAQTAVRNAILNAVSATGGNLGSVGLG